MQLRSRSKTNNSENHYDVIDVNLNIPVNISEKKKKKPIRSRKISNGHTHEVLIMETETHTDYTYPRVGPIHHELEVNITTKESLCEDEASIDQISTELNELFHSSSSDTYQDYLIKQERRIKFSRTKNTIWSYIRKGNYEMAKLLIDTDISVIHTRGPLGELPIHACYLNGGDFQLEIAWYMISKDQSIALAEYSDKGPFFGENILHISIIKRKVEQVRSLLQLFPSLLIAQASGTFFKYGQACYYGEYPLLFAAAVNEIDILNILLEHGADLDVEDSNGNNIFHILVIHNNSNIYQYLKERWLTLDTGLTSSSHYNDIDYFDQSVTTTSPTGKLYPWSKRNKQGYTPFTLSAKLGIKSMFHFLLEERKFVQWEYGPITCLLYPLHQIDTLVANKAEEPAYKSCLELIINESHFELLEHPRIKELLNKKWDNFAKQAIWSQLYSVIAYLAIFTLFTTQRRHPIFSYDRCMSEEANCLKFNIHSRSLNICLETVLFILVLLGAIWKAWRKIMEMYSTGFLNFFHTSGSAILDKFLSVSYIITIFIFAGFYMVSSPLQTIFLGFASVLAYCYLFFYLLAFKETGLMVIMVYKMLINDIFRFLMLYVVFLVGFGQGFYVFDGRSGIYGLLDSIKICFVATLGNFDFEVHDKSPFRLFSMTLLVLYIVIVSILLLNLLIAMMGDTYGRIEKDAENQWTLERTRIIFSIEREMNAEERANPKNKYYVDIDGARYMQILDNEKTRH